MLLIKFHSEYTPLAHRLWKEGIGNAHHHIKAHACPPQQGSSTLSAFLIKAVFPSSDDHKVLTTVILNSIIP